MSGSLYFGTAKRKDTLLLELCALLGYGTLKLTNRLTPVLISQNRSQFYPPSKKLQSIEHFIEKLATVELLKSTIDLKDVVLSLYAKIKQKSLIVLVGDFVQMVDLTLLAKKHEILVVIVRDRFEEDPESLGDVEITDPESGESTALFLGKNAVAGYRKAYRQHDHLLYKHFNALGVKYIKVMTDEDPLKKIMHV